ncbi:VWA domain-containing protein [uncultured Roseobacter sp.]|uniref:vWA domain-containing protein n=1 Tax=uncultured Roseobacter sp. TaxID=114847 RepID=UPI00261E088E|nr:VWA domain-containing protein [uncultured Roseobacter sp.]
MTAPRALDPFLRFAQALRGAGYPVSPDQTTDFIASVGLLGPRDMTDIYRSGRALFAIQPERVAEYDALFRAVFLDQVIQAPADGDDEDELDAYEPRSEHVEVEADTDDSPIGAEPTGAEKLSQRQLSRGGSEALHRLLREGARALPRRMSYRRRRAKNGDRMDMRRTLREAAKRDGEVIRLLQTRRVMRQRRVVVLIDVSGSMKERSEDLLRLAHAVVQTADRAEVFTLGTRLTRITQSLKPDDPAQALSRASQAIADFDGGTRIGDALGAYLAVPRYAGFARGAAVIVLSDGLERGDPAAMIDAVRRLSRTAWRVDWLTPLAADPDYLPRTEGLSAVLPVLDHLGDGDSIAAVTDHILTMARL